MAKLPNCENAVADIKKFTEYCLDVDHDTGGPKAQAFRDVLGITLADAEFLRAVVLDAARTMEAVPKGTNDYGDKYEITFKMTGLNGNAAMVQTGWIVRAGEPGPWMTSCYITRAKKPT